MLEQKRINALYIGSESVAALKARRTSQGWVVDAWATQESPGDIREGIRRAIGSLGLRRGRISISIPDTSVNVNILELDELPGGKELEGVIRWKLSRALNLEDGDIRFDYQVLKEKGPARILAVSLREGAAFYEDTLRELGLEASRISTHSFNLTNLLSGAKTGGVSSVLAFIEGYLAIMFFKDGVMDFFRCRPFEGLESLKKELASTFLSYGGRNRNAPVEAGYLFSGEEGFRSIVSEFTRPEQVDAGTILKFGNGVDRNVRLKLLAAFAAGLDG